MKNLSLKILIVLSLVTLASCLESSGGGGSTKNDPAAKSEPAVPNKSSEQTKEGGISSGGGGTLPANPIKVHDFYWIITSAKDDLRFFINFMRAFSPENIDRFDPLDIQYKYYYSKKHLGMALEETDIEILNDRPCKDANGHDTDASIYASKPNTICLSAFSIAPKVTEYSAKNEIYALILHELSHQLGADENEAVSIQKQALHLLRLVKIREFRSLDAKDATVEILSQLGSIGQKISLGQTSDLKSLFDEIEKNMQTVYRSANIMDGGSALFGYEGFELNHYYFAIYNTAKLFALEKSSFYSNQKSDLEFLNKLFNGQASIKYSDLSYVYKNSYLSSNYTGDKASFLYKDLIIEKIENVDQLNQKIASLIKYYQELYTYINLTIIYDGPITHFSTPLDDKMNPWQKFVGNYDLKKTVCDQSDDSSFRLSSIEISSEKNAPEIINVFKSSSLYPLRYINNGETDAFINFGVVKVSEPSPTEAQITTESGTRWYKNYNPGQKKVSERMYYQGGQLFYNVQSTYFESKRDGSIVSNMSTCTYEAIKK